MLVKISLTFLTNFVAKITSRFAGKRISFEDISETQESRLNVKCHDRRFCKNSSNLPVSLGQLVLLKELMESKFQSVVLNAKYRFS